MLPKKGERKKLGNASKLIALLAGVVLAACAGGYPNEHCTPYCATDLVWLPPNELLHPFKGNVVFDAPTTWGFGGPISYARVIDGTCHLGVPRVGGPISRRRVEAAIALETANCNKIADNPTAAKYSFDPNLHSYGFEQDTPIGTIRSQDYATFVHQPPRWRSPFEKLG